MRSVSAGSLLAALLLLAACADAPPPEAAAAPAPAPPPPVEVALPPPAPAPTVPEPTAEEKKKAKQAQELADYRAKVQADDQAETARLTPGLHAQAKALADKSYPTGHAAIQAAIAGKHRKPGNADRDIYRHPLETLDFYGFKPGMTVLEYGPGEGWYTELLAPALAKKGKLIVSTGNPDGPADQESTARAQAFKLFLGRVPEAYGKIQTMVIDGKVPANLGLDGKVDMVVLNRELHGMQNNGTLASWLGELRKTLKPRGILGVEQHRAPADANPVESAKKGYLPEKWVVAQIEAAGFKLAGSSEINANPKDTKDYAEGVWTLPPSFALKDKDHDKYAAIGESDRMTLRFVKLDDKAMAAAAKK